MDKATLTLPGRQDDLVSAVAAVADRTVVVVNAATPVLMPWLDDVEAVLWAGIPGQEGGHAVAAALTNDIEPAGRLVTSFPVEDGAAPAWRSSPSTACSPTTRACPSGTAATRRAWPRSRPSGSGTGSGTASGPTAPPRSRAAASPSRSPTPRPRSREVVQVYYDPSARASRSASWAGRPPSSDPANGDGRGHVRRADVADVGRRCLVLAGAVGRRARGRSRPRRRPPADPAPLKRFCVCCRLEIDR